MEAGIFKKLRIDAGITQKELAKKLNMSPSMISHYECGRKQPLVETECLIADYFDVTLEYLNGRSKYQELEEELNRIYVKGEALKDLLPIMVNLNKESRAVVSSIIHALYISERASEDRTDPQKVPK